jgi:hypothetical protein
MADELYRDSRAPVEIRVVVDMTTRTVERMARLILSRQRLLVGRQLVIASMSLALPALMFAMRVRQRQAWWFALFLGVWMLILAARLPGSVARITVRRHQKTPGGIGPYELAFSADRFFLRNASSRHEYVLGEIEEVVLLKQGLLIVIAQGQGVLVERDCHLPDGQTFEGFCKQAIALWSAVREGRSSTS